VWGPGRPREREGVSGEGAGERCVQRKALKPRRVAPMRCQAAASGSGGARRRRRPRRRRRRRRPTIACPASTRSHPPQRAQARSPRRCCRGLACTPPLLGPAGCEAREVGRVGRGGGQSRPRRPRSQRRGSAGHRCDGWQSCPPWTADLICLPEVAIGGFAASFCCPAARARECSKPRATAPRCCRDTPHLPLRAAAATPAPKGPPARATAP
jgi:hypothetical protein